MADEGKETLSTSQQAKQKWDMVGDKIKERMQMSGQVKQSLECFRGFVDPKYIKEDKKIPLDLIKKAKGIAIISQVKAGFMFTGIVGTGIVLAQTENGTWSGPYSIGSGGAGFGFQVGASKTDSVIVLNTDEAVRVFSGKAQVRLGADLQVAAGPLGRDAAVDVGMSEKGVSPAFAYSHSKGLFAGVSLQGMVISGRPGDNAAFYGRKVTAEEVLSGKVAPAIEDDNVAELHKLLNAIMQA